MFHKRNTNVSIGHGYPHLFTLDIFTPGIHMCDLYLDLRRLYLLYKRPIFVLSIDIYCNIEVVSLHSSVPVLMMTASSHKPAVKDN